VQPLILIMAPWAVGSLYRPRQAVLVLLLSAWLVCTAGLVVTPGSLDGTEAVPGGLTQKQLAILRYFAHLTIHAPAQDPWRDWPPAAMGPDCDGNSCVRYQVAALAYAVAIAALQTPAYTEVRSHFFIGKRGRAAGTAGSGRHTALRRCALSWRALMNFTHTSQISRDERGMLGRRGTRGLFLLNCSLRIASLERGTATNPRLSARVTLCHPYQVYEAILFDAMARMTNEVSWQYVLPTLGPSPWGCAALCGRWVSRLSHSHMSPDSLPALAMWFPVADTSNPSRSLSSSPRTQTQWHTRLRTAADSRPSA
jgi:hypothetical protein